MEDELMKSFLEMLIESVDGLSEALRVLLQYYHIRNSEEKKNRKDNSMVY